MIVPGDTIAIEVNVMDIDAGGRILVNNKCMDRLTWINPEMIRRTEAEIRKEAMEHMYEVFKYLVRHEADGGAGVDDFLSMFGVARPGVEELSDYTADEFYNKVSEYMAIHSFNVGDLVFVRYDEDEPGVITRVENSGRFSVLWYDGSCSEYKYQELKKYTDAKKCNKIFEVFSEMMQEVKK